MIIKTLLRNTFSTISIIQNSRATIFSLSKATINKLQKKLISENKFSKRILSEIHAVNLIFDTHISYMCTGEKIKME